MKTDGGALNLQLHCSWISRVECSESMNVRLIRDLEKVMSLFRLTQDMAELFDSHWTVIVWNVGGRKK